MVSFLIFNEIPSQKACDMWEKYSILQEVSNFGYNQAKKKKNKQTEYTPTDMTLGHTKPGGTHLLFAKTITHFHTIITLYLNDVFHSLLIVFLLLDASVSYV